MSVADGGPPRFRATALGGVVLAAVIVGAGVGGVAGPLVAGFMGIVAVPVIGFTQGLAVILRQTKDSEEAARLIQHFTVAYLRLFALLLPYRLGWSVPPGKPSEIADKPEWPEKVRKELGPVPKRPAVPGRDFWSRLELEEQDALTRLGETVRFPDGTVICRQGERGDRVYVLRSGRVEIRHDDGSGPRTVAERGVGDLIGERSAFELRERSATMVAIGPVDALVVETSAFTEFVERHPAVLEKIERGLYERLTERRPFRYEGQNCTTLMADICSFNGPERTDEDRLAVRGATYSALRRSLERSGVRWEECHWEDRGDGALIIIPPTLRTRDVLHPMVELLAEEIAVHGLRAAPGEHLAVRLAVGVGPVTRDEHGMVGQSINNTARLLDAPEFKARMRDGVSVGVLVSEFVHETVVRHLPSRTEYERIDVVAKETRTTGWVRLL
jgi:CRP-like cAMP-binding protein